MAKIMFAAAMLPAILTVGCTNGNKQFMTEQRLRNGLVVILPGIEGESGLNRDIRRGLVKAGDVRAIPIWPWGRPVPLLGLLINQIDFLGNRLAGASIAKRIADYQDKHPGRPVYVIGHSGGGGVAVFVAESMPKDHKLDGLVLLSASISSAYDLTKALGNCRGGIVNYYSREDVGLLAVGTTVLGTVDGTHGPSAGLLGFDAPSNQDKKNKKDAYQKLTQISLAGLVYGTAHELCTSIGFVREHVSKWISPGRWPSSYSHEEILAGKTDIEGAMLASPAMVPMPAPPPPDRSASTATVARTTPKSRAPALKVRTRKTRPSGPRVFKPITGLGRRKSQPSPKRPRFNAVKYKLRPG